MVTKVISESKVTTRKVAITISRKELDALILKTYGYFPDPQGPTASIDVYFVIKDFDGDQEVTEVQLSYTTTVTAVAPLKEERY